MVGMVGTGRTTRARRISAEHRAVRLTPDEWMIPPSGGTSGTTSTGAVATSSKTG